MRKRRKRYTERPTVYIAQPDFEKPAASMQSEYRTPKNDPATNSNKPEIPVRPKKTKRKVVPSLEKEQPIDEVESDSDLDLEIDEYVEEVENDQYESSDEIVDQDDELEEPKNIQNKKPFVDMSIIEQIDYLATPRAHVPKIITETERYRGIITAVDDDLVKVETFRRPKFHQIKLEKIHSIRLLGF